MNRTLLIILLIGMIALVGCTKEIKTEPTSITCPSLSCPSLTCPDCTCNPTPCSNNTGQAVRTDCTTIVRLLTNKEKALEDCWMNSNATTIVTNYTYKNNTLQELYDNCSAKLVAINESLGG